MINVLFLGCIYSEAQKDVFLKKSRRGYQFAAQNLQESLIDGFVANDININVLTIPALSTFPRGYKSPFVKNADFVIKGNVLGRSMGYLNIPFKNHVDYSAAAEYIDQWYNNTKGKHVIFVYALLGQQMYIATAAKRRHSDIKLCIIVPDLPRFMGGNKYYKKLGLQEKSINSIYTRIKCFDSLVVLAEPMVADLGMADRPYIVVEGIYSGNSNLNAVDKTKELALLYTGALVLRYGIGDLLDAFMKIDDKRFRLWLCGIGDAVDYIKECKRKDNRIIYFGKVSKSEAETMQKKATLLINPRHSSEELTKYSFPSKTIEYMASGTPTLMCHLPSIPSEYDEHLFYFTDETIDGMAATMVEICEKPSSELSTKGLNARKFVISKKNAKDQVARIIGLLNQI